MIPALTVMIGLYIVVRMVELIVHQNEQRDPSTPLMTLAGVTAIAAIIGMAFVIYTANQVASVAEEALRGYPF